MRSGTMAGRAIFGQLARPSSAADDGRTIRSTAASGREIIIGGPFGEAAQRRGDRRHVEQRRPAAAAGCRRPPRSAAAPASQATPTSWRGPSGATTTVPGSTRHAVGNAIVERAERRVQGDDADAGDAPRLR